MERYDNNGLISKVWGTCAWRFLHCVSFGYPQEPSEDQVRWYYEFFSNLTNILPCSFCRKSYSSMISEGPHRIDVRHFLNRDTLTKWVWQIHNAVNAKLGLCDKISYDELIDTYEPIRFGHPESSRAFECIEPVPQLIPLDLALMFVEEARRYLEPKDMMFINLSIRHGGNRDSLRKTKSWKVRNEKCARLLRSIRVDQEPAIISGRPSITELKLLMLQCSSLKLDQIKELVKSRE